MVAGKYNDVLPTCLPVGSRQCYWAVAWLVLGIGWNFLFNFWLFKIKIYFLTSSFSAKKIKIKIGTLPFIIGK